MELAIAIMMVLVIYVAIPAVIGFAIAGAYILRERRVRRVERAKAAKAAAEALEAEPAETHGEAVTKEPTKEHVLVA